MMEKLISKYISSWWKLLLLREEFENCTMRGAIKRCLWMSVIIYGFTKAENLWENNNWVYI